MTNYIITSTFSVDGRLHGKWLALMNDHYLPYLKEEGMKGMTFAKLLNNDPSQHTYSLQIKSQSVSDYSRYCEQMFSEYLKIATPLFGDGVLHFNSILKVIE